jgi:hypothetical protein
MLVNIYVDEPAKKNYHKVLEREEEERGKER